MNESPPHLSPSVAPLIDENTSDVDNKRDSFALFSDGAKRESAAFFSDRGSGLFTKEELAGMSRLSISPSSPDNMEKDMTMDTSAILSDRFDEQFKYPDFPFDASREQSLVHQSIVEEDEAGEFGCIKVRVG